MQLEELSHKEQMERLDEELERIAPTKEEKVIVVYGNKIDRKNLKFNIFTVAFVFGAGFILLSGNAITAGICATIAAISIHWFEKVGELKVQDNKQKV